MGVEEPASLRYGSSIHTTAEIHTEEADQKEYGGDWRYPCKI